MQRRESGRRGEDVGRRVIADPGSKGSWYARKDTGGAQVDG